MSYPQTLGRDQVMELLPHRPPVLLVDRVLAWTDTDVHAQVYSDPEWNIFEGHFPDRPILPGVLMIEMMAQSGALIGLLNRQLEEGTFLGFAGVEKARFRRPVVPGEMLDIHAEVTGQRRGFYKFTGRVEVSGEIAATSDFSATQMRFDT